MLESLHISNYALIDNVDIRFHDGLNIITGETGAGKSIMLGALSLLLGGRADTKAVRHPEKKSIIEAQFSAQGDTALKDYCDANDVEWDDYRFILRREISPNGRSRAFINDSPVPLSKLEGVALHLIDIHSQHQNQLLTQPSFQLKIIDTIAGNEERLRVFSGRFATLREALKRLKAMRQRIAKSRDDEEFLAYQLEQLDEMKLMAGEQAELERERDILSNMTEIKGHLFDALQALSDGTGNVLSLLQEARDAVSELDGLTDESELIVQRIESLAVETKDIAETLTEIDQSLMADPRDLEAAEERLNAIYALEAKHKVETVEELIGIRESLRDRLEVLDNSDETLAQLEKEARKAMALAKESAAEISEARKKAAEWFAAELKERATPLGMKNLRCEIEVSPADMSVTGSDAVEFTFAFNKNQPLMPVGGVASGGEISRLMLSIKTLIADRMQLPSIIFDEIDTGVSGDVAARMGDMMLDISRNIQVIVITHLPQVAAKGGHHFKVYKEDDEHSTHTRISELTVDERIDELALMLGGDASNEAARANARALLKADGMI